MQLPPHSIRRALGAAFVLAAALAAEPAEPRFDSDIRPMLNAHCVSCHGRESLMAGLDLRTPERVLRGGDNGPSVVPGDPEASSLLKRVVSDSMPPGDELKLLPQQKETLRRWIAAGAPGASSAAAPAGDAAARSAVSDEDRSWWAFQRVSRPAPPHVSNAGLARNEVDRFVLAKLEAAGLSYSGEADRRTFIRRASLDLTGLPPSPAEVDDFLADRSPQAHERLIDRLLASPHFGERWGRHWLDAAGYVDTYGREVQASAFVLGKGKWRYRDYVIGAFNDDKPYDRFLVEQLAGDELVDWRNAESFTPETVEKLVATGFLRTAEDPTDQSERDVAVLRYGVLQDTVKMFAGNVLGLTLGCAQCHTHKYEPIPQRDYYRMTAFFTPAYNPQNWRQPQKRILADIAPSQQKAADRHNAEIQARRKEMAEEFEKLCGPLVEEMREERLAAVPEDVREQLRLGLSRPERNRSNAQKQLIDYYGAQVDVQPRDAMAAMPAPARERAEWLEGQLRSLDAQLKSYGEIHAMFDLTPQATTWMLRGGDYESPGDEVEPGVLSVLDDPERPFRVESSADGSTSGRRLALARWLTDGEGRAGALVARVFVNRAWRHLFGEGIVATPDNLGRSGDAPTHPELLDWLAAEFVEGGWRLKPLLKTAMLSSAYRQASRRDDEAAALAVDPGNKLLWRMRLRRLESEAIRDSILSVSGQLSPEAGGPATMIKVAASGLADVDRAALAKPEDAYRRSVYLLQRRNNNLTMLTVFDQPVMRTNCLRRDSSAVVLQSLSMLNNSFVLEQSRAFAERMAEFGGADGDRRIDAAFRLALARPPSAREAAWSRELVAGEAAAGAGEGESWAALAHVLLNSSEFLYAH